jgi:uncharacterized protein (DUF1919 family)
VLETTNGEERKKKKKRKKRYKLKNLHTQMQITTTKE